MVRGEGGFARAVKQGRTRLVGNERMAAGAGEGMDGATGPRGRRSCWRSSSSFSRRYQPWEPRRQRGASPAPIWRAMSLSTAQSASDRLGGRVWGRVERGERCNGSAAQGPGPLDSSASAPHAGLCSCVSGHFQSPLALPLRRARSASAASTPLRAHRAPPEPIERGISAAPLPMAHRTSSHLHVIDINRESRAPITSCALPCGPTKRPRRIPSL